MYTKKAFSMVELVTVMAMVGILGIAAMPTMRALDRDSRFERFAAEVAGHFKMARRYAHLSESTVSLDFGQHESARYGCYLQTGKDDWRLLSLHEMGSGYEATIGLRLPNYALIHPTQGLPMKSPLASLHSPEFLFTPLGSSGGYVLFSDNDGRAICVVVSASTGRFQVFIQQRQQGSWRRFA